MTTADTATPGPSAWQRFRTWRRGRPFWGGLVAMIAGIWIYATPEQTIGGMQIKIGPGGMAAYIIPLILVAGGLLAWFTPAQRHFYGILIPAVSVYALLEINFGGWFIGTLLGMVGGALIFAWTEDKAESVDAQEGEPEPYGDDAVDTEHTPRHAAFDELLSPSEGTAIPRQGAPDGDREGTPTREKGGSGPTLAVAIVPLLLVVAAIAAVRGSEPAYAAPCPEPTARVSVQPDRTASKAMTPASPKAGVIASPSPKSPEAQPGYGLSLGTVVNATVNLVDPSPSPRVVPVKSPAPSASPETPKPQPSRITVPEPTGKPTGKPWRKPTACPSASPAKRLTAAAGQVDVAAKPSRMTGTKLTMTNLVFVGIVDLPTADGPITVLKFTMDQAVTDEFQLLTYARGDHTRDVVFKARQLTVNRNVAFYTSRFQGKLLGATPVDYTPANPPIIPLPDGQLPTPVFYTDPDIQLVWVNAGMLTGTPSLTSTLA